MSSFPANSAIGLCLAPRRESANRTSPLEDEVLALFDLLGARLLGYAVSFGISVQDGEDVVQETFLALFHHLGKQRSRENLKGWLYQVTHNIALKRRYRNRADSFANGNPPIEALDPAHDPEEQLLFMERHIRLQSVLNVLPTVDQSCLRLRADGFRYREISKILGISLGSVAASLARSLARLERAERR